MTKPERSAANVLAWAKEIGCPLPEIRESRVDRCYLAWSDDVPYWCSDRMAPWQAWTKAHRPWPGIRSAIRGWRERRPRWAAQIIEHRHPQTGERLIEIDFDRYNPAGGGAAYEIGHCAEMIWHKISRQKTDPFRVARERGWDQPSTEI